MVEYWKKMILDSWVLYKRNLTLFFFYAILMVCISLVGTYLIDESLKGSDLNNIGALFWIYSIGYVLLSIGLSIGLLKITDDLISGKDTAIQSIGSGFNYIAKFIAPYCLIIIPIIILMPYVGTLLSILLIIGGCSALFFYPAIIIKENLSITDSIRTSWDLLINNFSVFIQYILLLILTGTAVSLIANVILVVISGGDFSTFNSTMVSPQITIPFAMIMEFIERLTITPIAGIIYLKLYFQLSKDSNISMVDDFESENYESNS